MTEESWFDSRQGEEFYFLPYIQTGFEVHPASIHSVHLAVSSEVKRTGRETNNLHLSNAKVETACSYTSSPTYDFVIYPRTTLPLLLPLHDYHHHFKGDGHKIKNNFARHEESRVQHCQRPEIILVHVVPNDTSDSVFDQDRENCLIDCCICSPQIGTYTKTNALIFFNKNLPGFFNIVTRTTLYVKL
jgi:hypothetical protein